MNIAKAAVQKFASTLPSNAVISLRVDGHKGGNNGADKTTSSFCRQDTPILYRSGRNGGVVRYPLVGCLEKHSFLLFIFLNVRNFNENC